MNRYQTARTHSYSLPPNRIQSLLWQWPQLRHLVQISFSAASIEKRKQLSQEQLVGRQPRKVAAAPHQQGLLGGLLEPVMPLFDFAVLISLTSLDLLTIDAIMSQQAVIGSCELFGITQIVHGRAHPVGSMF